MSALRQAVTQEMHPDSHLRPVPLDNKKQAESKPTLVVEAGQMSALVDQTLKIMREHPNIFDLGDTLVTVSASRLKVLDKHLFAHWLGTYIDFVKHVQIKDGIDIKPIDPPQKLIDQLLSHGQSRALKPLRAVISTPVIRCDGSLLSEPGYDAQTQLYLTQYDASDFCVLTHPSLKDVQDALYVLMHPLKDFKFADSLDRTLLLAALLTAIVRPILETSPGFGIDAAMQGTGKTLLATAIATLCVSADKTPTIVPFSGSKGDEENRKRLFSCLLNSERTLIIDNVLGQFDSPSLAAAMTSGYLTDRVLGASKTQKLPVNILVMLTGNNLTLAGDMPRRIPTIRIVTENDDVPAFKRRFDLDPVRYIKQHRLRMVEAGLTIIKAWFCSADYRNQQLADGSLASFEDWDNLVRQPIAWISRQSWGTEWFDPMAGFERAQQADPEHEGLFDLLEQLHKAFNDSVFTAKDVMKRISSDPDAYADIKEAFEDYAPRLTARSVGRVLTYRKERKVNGLMLKSLGKQANVSKWRIECDASRQAQNDDDDFDSVPF